jgi:hypothetical protein
VGGSGGRQRWAAAVGGRHTISTQMHTFWMPSAMLSAVKYLAKA